MVNGDNNVVGTQNVYIYPQNKEGLFEVELSENPKENDDSPDKLENPETVFPETEGMNLPNFLIVTENENLLVHVIDGSNFTATDINLLIGFHYDIQENGVFYDTDFSSNGEREIRAAVEPGTYHIVAVAKDYSVSHVLGSSVFTIPNQKELTEISIYLE